jgi:general secretion pathway protein G
MPYREESIEELSLRRATVEGELAFVEDLIRQHRRLSLRARVAGAPWLLIYTFAAVCTLLAVGLWVATVPRLVSSRVDQARTDAQSIRGATEMYLAENPRAACPTVETLVRERILSSRYRTLDPWESKFAIECDGEDVEVVSPGPDRRLGTVDDVE